MKNNKKSRREFLNQSLRQLGVIGAAVAAPSVLRAEDKVWRWKMVTTWPKNFPGLGTGAEEIKSSQDFKGLKMRMPGLGGKVLTELGAAVVTLSGGEILQALKLGTIDASEWVGPYNDLAFGLHQAAKFYYYPGWHEPGTTLECMVNLKAYNSLPKDLQAVVKYACQMATEDMYAEFVARNGSALSTLVGTHKVQLKEFPKEVLERLGKISKDVVGEFSKKDALSKKTFESFDKFRKNASGWTQMSEESYTRARSLTFK